jgi:hypothetical protein
MEAKRSEVKKLDVNHLPAELRRQLLDALQRRLRDATDPLDIKCLEIGIENLKNSLD